MNLLDRLLSKGDSPEKVLIDAAAEWDKRILPLMVNSGIPPVRGNAATDRYLSGGYDHADRLHQIYNDFGYPEELGFDQFWNMYRRFGVAKAVCETIVDVCWVDAPVIKGSQNFNSQLEALSNRLPLWNRLKGLDKRQRVGSYAGLLIEVKDNKTLSTPMAKVSGGIDAISNIKPIYEGQLVVNEFDEAGNPTMYQFQPRLTGSRNPDETEGFEIHPSRLVVWAEDSDDGSIYGISALECVYNDLMDLRKISGAGAEGGYQNSRAVPVFSASNDFKAPVEGSKDKESFDNAITDWLEKFNKRLLLQGVEPHFNNVTIPNPQEVYKTSLSNIAAGSKVPQAVLIGQVTGVLAGDKDSRGLMVGGNSRRANFLSEGVSALIDWFITYGILPDSEFTVEWSDLLSLSDEERLALGESMAKTNRENFLAGQSAVYDVDEIREAVGYEVEEFDEPSEEPEDDD